MNTKPYDRLKAVEYAHKWAFGRNPSYYNFDGIGGDCTNFASQCIHAGGGVMNPTPTFGWYYYSPRSRAPAWSGVEYLYRFLVRNRSVGPVVVERDLSETELGDIIQISFDGVIFEHSPVVVSVGSLPNPSNILIAAHTYDADNRPLSSYAYKRLRLLHILHINVW